MAGLIRIVSTAYEWTAYGICGPKILFFFFEKHDIAYALNEPKLNLAFQEVESGNGGGNGRVSDDLRTLHFKIT